MKVFLKKFLFVSLIFFHLAYSQIKFAWITDTHIGSPNAEKDLTYVIQDINQRNINFTIITGDVTEKGLNSELMKAKEIFNQLNQPYFIIPGNHDTKWSESGCTQFNQLFGDDKFLFFKDEYCFIGLNSGIPLRGGGGHISPQDLIWLKSKLEKLPSSTKVIFAVHHPLDSEIDNSEEVINTLSKIEKVFVLVGHGHTNRPMTFKELKGAMGRSSLSKGKTPGYNLVSIYDDTISIQTIDFDENKNFYKNSITKIESSNPSSKAAKQPSFDQSSSIFDTKTTVVKTGIIQRDKLYFSDLSGLVYSIKLNGKLIWKRYLGTSFFAQPIIYGRYLILCGADGKVYFLRKSDGSLIKEIELTNSIIASPVIHKNFLIVFSNDGKINLINLKNFNFHSIKIAEKNFETIPLKVQDNIVIGNWDSYLYSIKINEDNSILVNWKWSENKNFYFSPAAVSPIIDKQNRIIISGPDKYISFIDFNSGKTLFRTNEFNSWETIGIDNEKTTLFVKGLTDTLYAIQLNNQLPKLKWKSSLDFGLDTNPIQIGERNNLIFVPAKNGTLYIVEKSTAKLFKKLYFGNSRLNNVVFINSNQLIISNMDGKFFRINLR
ncbi:MAG: metallophosphoesterase [Ignavibacteria bacterium]|nr:metallophosphoesterase [Ignavibacteria bacterium]